MNNEKVTHLYQCGTQMTVWIHKSNCTVKYSYNTDQLPYLKNLFSTNTDIICNTVCTLKLTSSQNGLLHEIKKYLQKNNLKQKKKLESTRYILHTLDSCTFSLYLQS